MNALEEIERAVKQLSLEDFAKFEAWMKRHKMETTKQHSSLPGKSGADWFDVYMTCPGWFEIPSRKKDWRTTVGTLEDDETTRNAERFGREYRAKQTFQKEIAPSDADQLNPITDAPAAPP